MQNIQILPRSNWIEEALLKETCSLFAIDLSLTLLLSCQCLIFLKHLRQLIQTEVHPSMSPNCSLLLSSIYLKGGNTRHYSQVLIAFPHVNNLNKEKTFHRSIDSYFTLLLHSNFEEIIFPILTRNHRIRLLQWK